MWKIAGKHKPIDSKVGPTKNAMTRNNITYHFRLIAFFRNIQVLLPLKRIYTFSFLFDISFIPLLKANKVPKSFFCDCKYSKCITKSHQISTKNLVFPYCKFFLFVLWIPAQFSQSIYIINLRFCRFDKNITIRIKRM